MSSETSANNEHKHPTACYVVGVLLLAYLGLALCTLLVVHLDSIATLGRRPLLRAHALCGGFGMLGASVACIRKYYRELITESRKLADGDVTFRLDWSFGRVYYYLTRPLLGAVLGALTYTLSFTGFQVLASAENLEISHSHPIGI